MKMAVTSISNSNKRLAFQSKGMHVLDRMKQNWFPTRHSAKSLEFMPSGNCAIAGSLDAHPSL